MCMMRMSDRLTLVEFLSAFINAVTDWSEMKTSQTSLLPKSIFSSFRRRFQTFSRKTEME